MSRVPVLSSIALTCLALCGAGPAQSAVPRDEVALSAAQRDLAGIRTTRLDAPGAAAIGRLEFVGRIEYAEKGPATVVAPTAGRVVAVFAHPGERVRRGETVLTLAGPEVATAHHGLNVATAASEAASRRLERDKALFEEGAISQARLEATRAQAREAESALAASRTTGAASAYGADGTLRIPSPANGIMRAAALAPGDGVAAGQLLVQVEDAPHIHAAISVPPAAARSLAVGDGAFVTGGGCEATGHLHAVAPAIEAETQAVMAHVALDDVACFMAGETVTVRVAPQAAAGRGYALPPSAFVTLSGRVWVFIATVHGYSAVEVDGDAARAGYARADHLGSGTEVVTRGAALLKAEWLKGRR